MWTVLYITQDEQGANKVIDVLTGNGIIYKLKTVRNSEDENVCYEVLVPETEINEAHDIILANNLM